MLAVGSNLTACVVQVKEATERVKMANKLTVLLELWNKNLRLFRALEAENPDIILNGGHCSMIWHKKKDAFIRRKYDGYFNHENLLHIPIYGYGNHWWILTIVKVWYRTCRKKLEMLNRWLLCSSLRTRFWVCIK